MQKSRIPLILIYLFIEDFYTPEKSTVLLLETSLRGMLPFWRSRFAGIPLLRMFRLFATDADNTDI